MSHEHAGFDGAVLHEIVTVLDGDSEYDFRLRQKITLVRANRIGSMSLPSQTKS
jgi:hypothetical protein